MSASTLRLIVDFEHLSESDLAFALQADTAGAPMCARRCSDLLRQVAGYSKAATLEVATGTARATAALTFINDPAADGTFVLCGTTFTGRASGASGSAEWNITAGGTNGADAAGNASSVADMVNAHSTVSKFVTAEAAAGVVTFTAKVPGKAGNGYVLSESLTNCTAANFSGGDEDTPVSLNLR